MTGWLGLSVRCQYSVCLPCTLACDVSCPPLQRQHSPYLNLDLLTVPLPAASSRSSRPSPQH